MFLYLRAFYFVKLCCNDDRLVSLFNHPFIHHPVIGRGFMPDINEQEYCTELRRAVQIPLDHLPPLLFLFFRNSGVSIPRQVDQIEAVVDIIEIDRLCFPRCCRSTRISLPVHERIDQGRFSYIRLSRKCDLRFIIYRQSTCNSAHCLQINTSDYHIILLSVLFPALHPYSPPV